MDRVDNINKLQGWRLASTEELQVIQGLLLQDAKQESKSDRIINVFMVLFSYVCFVGVGNIYQYIKAALNQDSISDVIILGVILIALVLIAVALVITFIKNVKAKTTKLYQKAVKSNQMRVNDVEIYKVISLRGVGNGTDGHRVKVKDSYNTYCEENIVFECCNGYQETKALLIEVIISKNGNETISRKCVIPCREYDPKLWKIGMKYYNKIMK